MGGGRDVDVNHVSEALWPDVDGDMAFSSFKITLHRLRMLLGKDKALRLHDGCITLDQRYCWMDTQAFEELAERAGRADEDEAPRLIARAIELYRGNFLPADTGESWSASLRGRLRRKYHHLITALGVRQEKQGHYQNAIDLYHRQKSACHR